jgi:dTDP-4-dehydrorhamnose reductase
MFYLDTAELTSLQDILIKTDPEIIISSLRGDYDKQLLLHKTAAQHLANKKNAKFIYISSANAFDHSVETPHYESDMPSAESAYGIFKVTCEKMLMDLLQEKAVIIRVPFIWSKQAPRFLRIKQDISEGIPVLCHRNLYSNHTTDLQIARYIHHIIRYDWKGIFHVGSTDIIEYKDFVEKLIIKMNCSQYVIELDEEPDCKYYMAMVSERSEHDHDLTVTIDDIIDYLTISNINHNEASNS